LILCGTVLPEGDGAALIKDELGGSSVSNERPTDRERLRPPGTFRRLHRGAAARWFRCFLRVGRLTGSPARTVAVLRWCVRRAPVRFLIDYHTGFERTKEGTNKRCTVC